MHNMSYLFYFGNNTLHVSDGLSFHHQESKTVHTASGIRVCHTGSVAVCQQAATEPVWYDAVSKQPQNLYGKMLYVQS